MTTRPAHHEVLDAWLSLQRARNFSPKTLGRRLTSFRSFERFHAPNHVFDATADSCAEWLSTFTSPATRHAYRSDMSQLLLWALKRGLVKANPFDEVGAIRVPTCLPRPLPAAELTLVIDTAESIGGAYGLMLLLGALAGFRNAEIAALCWEDINAAEGLLVVRNGKGGKDRVVPLHPRLQALLGTPKAAGPVLLDINGKPFTSSSVGLAIATAFKFLNIKATPHQLRHSFGTELAKVCNGDLLLVASVMGHGNVAPRWGMRPLQVVEPNSSSGRCGSRPPRRPLSRGRG